MDFSKLLVIFSVIILIGVGLRCGGEDLRLVSEKGRFSVPTDKRSYDDDGFFSSLSFEPRLADLEDTLFAYSKKINVPNPRYPSLFSGIQRFDLSDKKNPTVKNPLDLDFTYHSLIFWKPYAFSIDGASRVGTLRKWEQDQLKAIKTIKDVSICLAPVKKDNYGIFFGSLLSAQGNKCDEMEGKKNLMVFDIDENPENTSSKQIGVSGLEFRAPVSLVIEGENLFVCDERDRTIKALNVKDPLNPQILGMTQVMGCGLMAASKNNLVLVLNNAVYSYSYETWPAKLKGSWKKEASGGK